MQPIPNITPRLLAGIAVAVLLAGCATTKTTEAPATKPAAAQKDEYVHVNSLGSWVPKKVKKNTVPEDDGSTTTVSADAMGRINETGATKQPPPPNGQSKTAASGL